MRNIRVRTVAVAATALLAGLSLTACQNDDGTAASSSNAPSAGGANSPAPGAKSPSADQKTPPSGDATGASAGGGKGSSGSSGSGKSSGGSSASGGSKDAGPTSLACTGSNTKVKVDNISRPINHMMLSVTNTGSKACNAYHAPLLRFDDAQAVTQFMDGTKPQAVATLAPGETAYALIRLSAADGSGEHGQTAKRLTVHFAPASGSGSTGSSAALTLPANTHIDSSSAVSYWQTSFDDALAS
ncbi:DUF4232 domain-containing protein [Streptomyces sp. NPDC051907]|uniref:DUF4232 domain-containing protein n=1 Tax=Streptomyces sp. NPDC051907 TaxID=3155284 RepID=UPI00342EF553